MAPELLAIFGLFERHATATPSPAPGVVSEAVGAVKGIPIGMWIAIVGFFSAIAGPIVAHVLEGRRAKKNAN